MSLSLLDANYERRVREEREKQLSHAGRLYHNKKNRSTSAGVGAGTKQVLETLSSWTDTGHSRLAYLNPAWLSSLENDTRLKVEEGAEDRTELLQKLTNYEDRQKFWNQNAKRTMVLANKAISQCEDSIQYYNTWEDARLMRAEAYRCRANLYTVRPDRIGSRTEARLVGQQKQADLRMALADVDHVLRLWKPSYLSSDEDYQAAAAKALANKNNAADANYHWGHISKDCPVSKIGTSDNQPNALFMLLAEGDRDDMALMNKLRASGFDDSTNKARGMLYQHFRDTKNPHLFQWTHGRPEGYPHTYKFVSVDPNDGVNNPWEEFEINRDEAIALYAALKALPKNNTVYSEQDTEYYHHVYAKAFLLRGCIRAELNMVPRHTDPSHDKWDTPYNFQSDFETAESLDPFDINLYIAWGRALWRADQLDDAKDIYQRAILQFEEVWPLAKKWVERTQNQHLKHGIGSWIPDHLSHGMRMGGGTTKGQKEEVWPGQLCVDFLKAEVANMEAQRDARAAAGAPPCTTCGIM